MHDQMFITQQDLTAWPFLSTVTLHTRKCAAEFPQFFQLRKIFIRFSKIFVPLYLSWLSVGGLFFEISHPLARDCIPLCQATSGQFWPLLSEISRYRRCHQNREASLSEKTSLNFRMTDKETGSTTWPQSALNLNFREGWKHFTFERETFSGERDAQKSTPLLHVVYE